MKDLTDSIKSDDVSVCVCVSVCVWGGVQLYLRPVRRLVPSE